MSTITVFTTGLWPNAERNGLTTIAGRHLQGPDEISKQCVYTDDLVAVVKGYSIINLVGHSFGGWQSLQAARTLNDSGIAVNKLILLDPVEESPELWNTSPEVIPPNVKRTLCMQKDAGWTAILAIAGIQPPSFPAIYGTGFGSVESLVIRGATWHATFPEYTQVSSLVIQELAT